MKYCLYFLLCFVVLTNSLFANPNVEKIVKKNSKFALELYRELIKTEKGNLFFSPYSISTALAMVYAGARGETAKEMAKTCRFTMNEKELHETFSILRKKIQSNRKSCRLSVANSLWAQKGYCFWNSYFAMLSRYYEAGVKTVDFKNDLEDSRKTINEWVSKKTEEKIKELFQKGILNKMVRLVLVNAIYFKGTWRVGFDAKKTKKAPFHLNDGKEINVPTMYVKDNFKYAENKVLQALELPYSGNKMSLLVLLPRNPKMWKFVESKMNLRNIKDTFKHIKMKKVAVYLPKFKMSCGFSLGKILKKMGMRLAFSMGADFSGMTGRKDLAISKVIHKSFVKINESGTEAAATTGVTMFRKSAPAKPTVFRVDRPFIFIIYDRESKSILFMGRVMNPLK